MGRKFQRLAIVISIFIVIVAYFIYLPDTEGVEQMNRIRSISASMKIIRFIVSTRIFFCGGLYWSD
jgi:uncharacterized protein with PQ loop repeat